MSGISRICIFCLAVLIPTAIYMPLANGQASISGLFAQSRSLANLIGYGIKNNTKSWTEVLNILERADVSKEMGDEFRKLVGKSMTEGSATLPEHLERIESAVRALEPEIDNVVARLNGEQRPNLSVDDLANNQSRCNTIDVLRDEQRKMGEDIKALKGLSALLDKAEDKIDILGDLSLEMASGYEEMFDELYFRIDRGNISVIPALIAVGMFANQLQFVIIQLNTHNMDQIRTIDNVITRLRRKLESVPRNIDQLKSNFDANMESFIDPLSADSCDDNQIDKELESVRIGIDEEAAENWKKQPNKSFSGDAYQRALQHFQEAIQAADRQAMGKAVEAINAGLQAWSLAMQQGQGPAGNDQRCQQARAQVRAYDGGIRKINPSHSRQHAQARSLYVKGRKANQEWIQAHC